MAAIWDAITHWLATTGSMTWQITWSLILGFTLSAIIESLVRKSTISRLLPDDRPRSLVTAAGLGAASSSCSYAAVALARSLVRKGADFTAAMAFTIASTNLVIELGLILALLLGWQFTLAICRRSIDDPVRGAAVSAFPHSGHSRDGAAPS
jgi:uncharacterized membrane protein YraQ (UPF0718 family)